MLTDYSSVAFDFGYTHKPLVYTFFDKDHLFQIHTVITNDGEFDFEKDGFGPVEYDYESTLKALIKIIDSGFKNDKKYIDRVNKYFKYHDDENCERVYNETLKMLERTK
jgi:CDP-glycerol glycerophosphotransferase (TagB/SpsB family)